MALTTELSAVTFGLLFASTILASFLAGSTVQWAINKGLLKKKLFAKVNQYNVLVTIAAISSMIHTLLCFFNNVMAPNLEFGVAMSVVVNWVIMTNFSILLVSQRLSLTFPNPTKAWKRLLWINYIAVPLCIFIGTSWAISWNMADTPGLDRMVLILEPVQIGLFGLVEFALSGAFIFQMWKYHWTAVERHGMVMLVLVGCCDLASVLLNVLMGDLESTCVKGLVYSLRIRLEVNVLCCMVDHIKNRRNQVSFGNSDNPNPRKSRRSMTRLLSGFSSKRLSITSNHRRDSELHRLGKALDATEQNHSFKVGPSNTSQIRSSFTASFHNRLKEELVPNNNNNGNQVGFHIPPDLGGGLSESFSFHDDEVGPIEAVPNDEGISESFSLQTDKGRPIEAIPDDDLVESESDEESPPPPTFDQRTTHSNAAEMDCCGVRLPSPRSQASFDVSVDTQYYDADSVSEQFSEDGLRRSHVVEDMVVEAILDEQVGHDIEDGLQGGTFQR